MADPSPEVGLPGNEWIELMNRSGAAINLRGWRIGDAAGESGMLPNFILQPGAFVIICTGSAVNVMSAFGATVSVTSFPSLGNDGDLVYLKSPEGHIAHAVQYESSWYANELKKEGGWTLEMMDPSLPCGGQENWTASTDIRGGTPGTVNAVFAARPDEDAPAVLHAYTTDAYTIHLVLSEPADSAAAANLSGYSISDGISILSAAGMPPLYQEIKLTLAQPLQEENIYTITITQLSDCNGNTIPAAQEVKTGRPSPAAKADVVINELLFNPRPDGYDYIELFNRSQKLIDLGSLHIANRNSAGDINDITRILPSSRYLFPDEYIVITQDAQNLAKQYHVKNPGAVISLSSLPSYPDDKGSVILLEAQGNMTDEVAYHKDWHFKLISDPEGVALERINPDDTSQKAANWHSAASTAGYGTPGYQNSQYKKPQGITATFEVKPKVFSPDNNGTDDIATLQYQLDEPAYVANVTIFDAAGRPVRSLVRNALLSTTGYWHWDGLNDKAQKLPVGTYIFFIEIFNAEGKRERFKQTVVLARRLQ